MQITEPVFVLGRRANDVVVIGIVQTEAVVMT